MADVGFRKQGRNVNFGVSHWQVSPDFGTDVGFVRRVDIRQTNVSGGYTWWPVRSATYGSGWVVQNYIRKV